MVLIALRRVSMRFALVAWTRAVAELDDGWGRPLRPPAAAASPANAVEEGLRSVVSWMTSRSAARDWVWSSSWMASRRAAWTLLMWAMVRRYWSLWVSASSWARVMACTLQMRIGDMAGLRRSSSRGSVRGGGREPPSVCCADTSPGSPGEEKVRKGESPVPTGDCDCVSVRMIAPFGWSLE